MFKTSLTGTWNEHCPQNALSVIKNMIQKKSLSRIPSINIHCGWRLPEKKKIYLLSCTYYPNFIHTHFLLNRKNISWRVNYFFSSHQSCFKFENKNTNSSNYDSLHFSCWFTLLTFQVSLSSKWKVLIFVSRVVFFGSRTKKYLKRQFQHHNRHLFIFITQTPC